ncbi:MAG: Cna B-type domain-containing protein, partial [Bacilli bacterium]|nr:Cna B-type domain-containing protein [Bacilli bacterium]
DTAYNLYKNNDSTIENYVKNNGYIKDYEGYAYFYSNYYASGNNGTTEVDFTPYYFNDYYYYTSDTYLYIKNGNTYSLYNGASLPSGTYYTKKTIYHVGDKIPFEDYYEVTSNTTSAQKDNRNNWYIESGTKKNINDSEPKTNNAVQTAPNVSSTKWNNSNIQMLLGNNGKTMVHLDIDKIDLKVSKSWDDENNQDGKRPKEVSVELFANGNSLGEDFIIKLNETNNWTYTYQGLPEKSGGQKISYTIEEKDITEDYAISITGSIEEGYVITNSYNVEVLDISVNKIWDDNNNQDGKRSENVTIMLEANGEPLGDNYQIVLNADNNWTYTYQSLPKYKNGEEITYSVTEEEPSGYDAVISGTIEEGFTITNVYNPELISIKVNKIWNDYNGCLYDCNDNRSRHFCNIV